MRMNVWELLYPTCDAREKKEKLFYTLEDRKKKRNKRCSQASSNFDFIFFWKIFLCRNFVVERKKEEERKKKEKKKKHIRN